MPGKVIEGLKAVAEENFDAAISLGIHVGACSKGTRGLAIAKGLGVTAITKGFYGIALAEGDEGAAVSKGEQGMAVSTGRSGYAKGINGSALVLCERDGTDKILAIWSGIVGQDGIKPDMWYTLIKGKPEEVEEEKVAYIYIGQII